MSPVKALLPAFLMLMLLMAADFFSSRNQFQAADPVTLKPNIESFDFSKILFLGNSITLHGPAAEIGWTGNWGMAASAVELDYVHLLTAEISRATSTTPRIRVRNIADFERGYEKFDIDSSLKADLEFDPDLVIVAIGENVAELSTPEARDGFSLAFSRLLTAIKSRKPKVIVVRSCFGRNPPKDQILRKSSSAVDALFVDISKLADEESNFARSERVIEHAGVAGHPGDKGMRAICDAILEAIQKRSNQDSDEKN
jgi:lysophospholipase L1-like esterase